MLYQQIENNKRKSLIFIIVFFIFCLSFGYALGLLLFGDLKLALIGLISMFAFTVFYIPIKIFTSKKSVMNSNNALQTTREQHPQLWNIIEDMSLVANIPMPDIYIVEEESPNAFASGLNPDNAAIAVTTGLIKKLNREELEAVIAHEISHISNYDVKLSTITISLVSFITIFSDIATRYIGVSNKNDNKKSFPLVLIAFIFVLISPFISYIIHLSLSRNREFLADSYSVKLCRNPMALASALTKITNYTEPAENVPDSYAPLYFSDPFKKNNFSTKLSTHPTVEERIKRLSEM